MAATDGVRRRFITRHDVEDAARSGQPIRVSGCDVVTDEAAQRAEDLGVRIERDRPARAAAAPAPAAVSAAPADVREAVRRAVVVEFGREPDGLAAAIERVMERVMERRGR